MANEQIEILSRLRGLLNEATAGFFTDAKLYQYLDSAQMECITLGKSKQDYMRKADKGYECSYLQPLINTTSESSPVALVSGTYEYAVPTGFLWDVALRIDVDNTRGSAPTYPKSTLNSYSDVLWKEDSSFTMATARNPRHYIRNGFWGVRPIPSAVGHYILAYYKRPVIVDGSNNFTLNAETHNVILYLAFSYALLQNNRNQESQNARQIAINLIKDL
jgi:hypothetical protein